MRLALSALGARLTPLRAPLGRWGFVGLFFFIALAPLLQTLTGLIPVKPIQENRNLAPWAEDTTPWRVIPRTVDRWYADHFGFRPWFIRLKTQIDYSVFKTSDRVLIGKDRQLFYRSVVLNEEPYMQVLLETKAAPALANIERLCAALRVGNVRCAFVVPRMSDRFYPELLPDGLPPRPAHPRIDDFLHELAAIPEVLYVDSEAILREEMKSRRVFPRTDFHWNDPAAFGVAKALVDRMSAADGLPSPWTHELEIETKRTSGGIATFMPLFSPPRETSLMVKPNWPIPAGFKEIDGDGPYDYTITTDPNPRLLPSTLVVGDSYFDGIQRSGFTAQFNELRRIRWRPIDPNKATEIVAQIPPDARWLVFEFIEVAGRAIVFFADTENVDAAIAAWKARGSEGSSR